MRGASCAVLERIGRSHRAHRVLVGYTRIKRHPKAHQVLVCQGVHQARFSWWRRALQRHVSDATGETAKDSEVQAAHGVGASCWARV